MGSICAEMPHKFRDSHQLYSNKKSIEIPRRKLLGRLSTAAAMEFFMESPKGKAAIFRRFLPYNNDDDDPYSADDFRMFEFKVRKCSRSRSHDWTDCPFAHPGEKARRRDPRKYNYTGTVCAEFRKGYCGKGDLCEYSHGVFESWLHPTRYRTEACKDGKNCQRKVCFFAHSARQLRTPSSFCIEKLHHHCCIHCHSITNSPTSTLLCTTNLSPGPNSPVFNSGRASYKDAMTELTSSFEAMNVNDFSLARKGNFPWIDEQPHFILSPSTSSTTKLINEHNKLFMEDRRYNINEGNLGGPDLGWVNDLLT